MDQEKGSPAPIQKSPYHPTLIPGTSKIALCVEAIRRSCENVIDLSLQPAPLLQIARVSRRESIEVSLEAADNVVDQRQRVAHVDGLTTVARRAHLDLSGAGLLHSRQ